MTAGPPVARLVAAATSLATPAGWDDLPCALMLVDAQGVALAANAALASTLGLPRESLLGTGWQALVAAEVLDELRQRIAGAASFRHAWRWLRGDGSSLWVECEAGWRAAEQHYAVVLHDMTAARRSELAAQTQAAQFRLLTENLPALIAYYELEGFRCRFANRRYATAFGLTEQSIVGRSFAEIIGDEASVEVRPHVERMLRDAQPVSYERMMPAGPRWLEVTMVPQCDADGRVVAAFVLVSDITKFRLAERQARESRERVDRFMQASQEGIVFHADGVITDANPALCELLGVPLEALRGRHVSEFVAPEFVSLALGIVRRGEDARYESVVLRADGERVPVELIGRTLRLDGQTARLSVVRDLRERHAAEARIHHLAHHDSLTGLPNRTAFIERLEHLTTGGDDGETAFALMFIDLDHFKRVNDSLGHLAGDRLLQTIASRIVGGLRSTDLVARFGGDEFLVLLPGLDDRETIAEVARKLLLAIESPVDVDGWAIGVSPSIGIALHPHDGHTPDALIKHADVAMYEAKSGGRATFRFFEPGIATAAYSALVLEGELAQAIERGEFHLVYQPQVDARSGALVGTEALIRWDHPLRGLLLPDAFMPLAEQRRLMQSIGDWTLREAARAAVRWQSTALAGVPVSVNLSTVQFDQPGFVDDVARALSDTGLPGALLELELTERMLMADLPSVKARLMQLKRLGIRISVDDFGTGYASLGHLKALPIDKIKIDQGFVRDLPAGRDSAAIARAIVQMGLSLGISVIAEGVENRDQQQMLARIGCDELQGHWIGQPMKPDALEAWAGARRPPEGLGAGPTDWPPLDVSAR